MVPLNKISDPDKVLPVKQQLTYDDAEINNADIPIKAFNKSIDQYNQLNIDGDVEKLAKELADDSGLHWENTPDWRRDFLRHRAEFIIANLDKFLFIRKGE